MSESKLHLSVTTPFDLILDEGVDAVIADTDAGQLAFLPHHASVTGSMTAGKLEVRFGSHVKVFFVRQGIFDLDNQTNQLKLRALQVEPLSDIELQTIREHLKNVEAD